MQEKRREVWNFSSMTAGIVIVAVLLFVLYSFNVNPAGEFQVYGIQKNVQSESSKIAEQQTTKNEILPETRYGSNAGSRGEILGSSLSNFNSDSGNMNYPDYKGYIIKFKESPLAQANSMFS